MRIKAPIIILLLAMIVGFATLTATVIFNNNSIVSFNDKDFDVIFTQVGTDGRSDATISQDGKSITFDSIILEDIGEEATLSYTVANNSFNYDSQISLNIEYDSTDGYFEITEVKKLPDIIEARSSSLGVIKITLKKAALTYLDYSFNITTDASSVERNSFGSNDTNENPTDPGLYLSDNKLLLSWDELVNNYDLNVSNDYSDYDDDSSYKLSNIIDVINHDYAMENQQYKLVLDSKIQKLGDYSLSHVEQLTSIKLNDGLLSVGNEVFEYDDNLTEIVFPDSITSFADEPIGSLENLRYVHFPPAYDHFNEYIFDSCPNIENVDMSNNYKSIDGVVYSADGSKLLLYPSGKKDTSFTIPGSVTYINYYAFEDTSNLTEVIFEDPRNWNVGGEFFSSNLLRDSSAAIEILRSEHEADEFIKLSPGLYSNYDEQVISWDEFEKKYSVDLSFGDHLWHRSTEDEFGQMASILKYNEELEDVKIIVIPETVEEIGENMFYNAANVEVILLPNSLKRIEDFAFYECTNLTYLDIPEGISYISQEFCHNCSSLTEINIPKNVTNIGIDAFCGSGLNRVYFENPSGWQYNGEKLDATELSDPAKAANYLGSYKHSYNWNRL